MKTNIIHHSDFLNNDLPDKSVQLIIADPPYFEVMGEFDFIWKSFDDYLIDIEKWAVECKRVLADNGTLFWYGNSKKIAYSQVIIDKYFNLESNVTIHIFDRQTNRIPTEEARGFINTSERLLLYSNETIRTGLETIMEEHIWHQNPFGIEIKRARIENGLKRRAFAEAIIENYKNIDSAMAQISNWELGKNIPVINDWNIIISILPIRKEYDDLRKEYDDLRKEYEELRRPFNPIDKYKMDVLRFSQEGNITSNYDHDTIKPEKLTRALIQTCSRKNDIVLAPFSGSGTECAMAVKEGRRYIGYDIKKEYVEMARKRCAIIENQGRLF